MKIIDAHTHIASTRFIPREFLDGVVDNMMAQLRSSPIQMARSKVLENYLAAYQDHEGEQQQREMDRLGVEKAVLLLPDFTYVMKDVPLSIAEMFAAHNRIRSRFPGRFEVFAGVDPRWGADGLNLFIKGVEEFGFSGLKLYPPCGYTADSPLLKPYYEYCEEKRLPVLLHTGPTSPALSFREAHPSYLDAPAHRYRNISFILAHGAVSHVADCVQLCKFRPNVYLDLSGAQCTPGSTQYGQLCELLRQGINHKIIFGTDWPVNNHASLNRHLLRLISGATEDLAVTPTDAANMLAGTIERLLGNAPGPA